MVKGLFRNRMLFCPSVLLMVAQSLYAQLQVSTDNKFMTGFDANYSIDLMNKNVQWKLNDTKTDLFSLLHKIGGNSLRVRVWTNDTGNSGKEYAGRIALLAQKAGLKPHFVFFLSENWADLVKQPAPKKWQNIDFELKCKNVYKYCEEITTYFKELGVTSDMYAIGNEIDFGICGEFSENWPDRFNMDYMEKNIWNKSSQIIISAQKGILHVNPHAKFMIHLAQGLNSNYCIAFLKYMTQNNVIIDYVGLSYYPTADCNYLKKGTILDLDSSVNHIYSEIKKPIIISEYAYPSLGHFNGQFSSWNKAIPGYTMDEPGQKKWITDFLSYCQSKHFIKGAFYWSPEYYNEELWKPFALFRENGSAKDAINAFRNPKNQLHHKELQTVEEVKSEGLDNSK